MAHFAEIGADNVVVRVLVVADEEAHRGQEFLADDVGLGGTWIQTDKNTRGNVHYIRADPYDPDGEDEPSGEPAFRGNYAGAGWTYDPDEDVFYDREPSEGDWVLNTETWRWEPVT